MALEESVVDGKPCILAYFDDAFETCEKAVATLIKVIFEDGSNMFVVPDELKTDSETTLESELEV